MREWEVREERRHRRPGEEPGCWVSGVAVLFELVKHKCFRSSYSLSHSMHDTCPHLSSLHSGYSIDPQACDCMYKSLKNPVFHPIGLHFCEVNRGGGVLMISALS